MTNAATPPAARGFSPRRFVDGLRAHNALEAAAAIAFWFFLSLLPLLAMLGWLVSQVARSRGVDALLAPVLDVAPGTAEDILRREIERMAGSTTSVAPLGVAGFLWTASSGLHNLMDVFETAARAEPRRWWKKRTIALAWVIVGLGAACLLAWLLVNVDSVLHANDPPAPVVASAPAPAPASASAPASAAAPASAPGSAPAPDLDPASTSSPPPYSLDRMMTHPVATAAHAQTSLKRRFTSALHTPTEELIAAALLLGVGMVFLAAFYRFAVEHPTGVRRRFWPGTIIAVASWLVVSWGFGLYAVSMSSYALYYGSLAAVAVMMVWLYLTSLSLVVGAEVNAYLERRTSKA
ncbi:MAG: YihY/virulence factor BrkB family protein [Polyangiaceae bacterium]